MLVRALAVATLLITASTVTTAMSEEQKPDPPRSLQPTEDELARFRLSQPVDVAVQDGSPLLTASGFGMFAASAADFATTEIGLASGLDEGNPIAQDRGVRLLHHVVGPAAVWWTTEKLQKSGRTKLALSLRIAVMVAYSYAAIHNARVMGSGTSAP